MDAEKLATAQQQLLETIIVAAGAEFKSLSDTYVSIDEKAQSTTTIAGVFLAAMFSLSVMRFDHQVSGITIGAVFVIMLTLLGSVIFSIFAMFARQTELPPCANQCLPDCSNLLESDKGETFQRDRLKLTKTWAEAWVKANDSVHKANEAKANWLEKAQIAILVAALATVFLGALLLFSPAAMVSGGGLRQSADSRLEGQSQPSPSTITVSPTITIGACSDRAADQPVQPCCKSADPLLSHRAPAPKTLCH